MIELKYFSTPNCSVCHHLKPALKEAVKETNVPVHWIDIDASQDKELAAMNTAFTVPVVIVSYEDQELARFVRVFGVHEVTDKLIELYQKMS